MIDRKYRMAIACGLVIAGIVVAILGYLGVSKETEVAFQLPYFASAGIGALLLFGGGAALLIATQLERDDTRIVELEEAVRLLGGEIARLSEGLSTPATNGKRHDVRGPVRTRG